MGDYDGSGWGLVAFLIIACIMLFVAFIAPILLLCIQFTFSILYFFGTKDYPFFRSIVGVYWLLLVLNTVLILTLSFFDNYCHILISYSAICIPYQILVKRNSHKLKRI